MQNILHQNPPYGTLSTLPCPSDRTQVCGPHVAFLPETFTIFSQKLKITETLFSLSKP